METEFLLLLLNLQMALLVAVVGWGLGYPPVAGVAVLGPLLALGLRRFFAAIEIDAAGE
jgi:hypothetical protein